MCWLTACLKINPCHPKTVTQLRLHPAFSAFLHVQTTLQLSQIWLNSVQRSASACPHSGRKRMMDEEYPGIHPVFLSKKQEDIVGRGLRSLIPNLLWSFKRIVSFLICCILSIGSAIDLYNHPYQECVFKIKSMARELLVGPHIFVSCHLLMRGRTNVRTNNNRFIQINR